MREIMFTHSSRKSGNTARALALADTTLRARLSRERQSLGDFKSGWWVGRACRR
jgi:hypothetical protein